MAFVVGLLVQSLQLIPAPVQRHPSHLHVKNETASQKKMLLASKESHKGLKILLFEKNEILLIGIHKKR